MEPATESPSATKAFRSAPLQPPLWAGCGPARPTRKRHGQRKRFADQACVTTVNGTPIAWDGLGRVASLPVTGGTVAASSWSWDNQPLELAASTGATTMTEQRRLDALGRVVAVTTTAAGSTTTVYRTWHGAALLDETWSNGWQRLWHVSGDLHRPLGYTLDCAAQAGACTPAPLGLDASAVVFDADGRATLWVVQDFGLDAVAVLDATGALLERYDTTRICCGARTHGRYVGHV